MSARRNGDLALMTLGEIPFHSASQHGRRTAIWYRDQTLSFRALAGRVAELAHLLQRSGLSVGQRVALHLDNSPDYLAAYFAVPACGGVLVPLNTFLAPAEIASILADAAPSMLFAGSPIIRRLLREPQSPLKGINVIPYEDVMGPGTPVRSHEGATFAPSARLSETDPAVMLYTSGTTGIPKGVVLSHRALISNARSCANRLLTNTPSRTGWR